MTRVLRDLMLGVRLAVGGSRTYSASWVRLGVGAVGIGLAVAVLLGAASAGTVSAGREARQDALLADVQPREGVRPTHVKSLNTQFGDEQITGKLLYHEDRTSPVPPGVGRQLGPDELMVSPELRKLLDAPENDLLRERFAGYDLVGTIGRAGIVDPADTTFVLGSQRWEPVNPGKDYVENAEKAYAFGGTQPDEPLPFELLLVIALGAVGLLVPLLIFVVASSRIGGAERDRRLAALRLVGADAAQVRRIAAGESLVPGLAGLLLGTALFLLLRPLVGDVRWWDVSFYAEDVVPSASAVVLIVLLVPLLSVGVALVALRRTVIEPLGVVRQGKPVRRRLWWRLATVAGGVGLLLVTFTWSGRGDVALYGVIGGSALLVLGVAMLLPWAVEAVIRWTRGGTPALQLAARRLQVDSGTAARVVSGVVVVLTGAVAVLLVLASVDRGQRMADESTFLPVDENPAVLVLFSESDAKQVGRTLRGLPGVSEVHRSWQGSATPASGDTANGGSMVVGDCFPLAKMADVTGCKPGSAYTVGGRPRDGVLSASPGQQLNIAMGDGEQKWTVPDDARQVTPRRGFEYNTLFLTPQALGTSLPDDDYGTYFLQTAPLTAAEETALIEQARTELGLMSYANVAMSDAQAPGLDSEKDFEQVRTLIYAGSMVVMFLAALSVLVLAVEQVRERRRALSAVSASGVGFGTLARSLLWQNTIPLCVGVGLAVGGGVLLAYLVMRIIEYPLLLDWVVIAGAAGLAGALVLFVTLLSMPALRAAVSVKNLRTE